MVPKRYKKITVRIVKVILTIKFTVLAINQLVH